jgi:large subunit ribosomal protein L17
MRHRVGFRKLGRVTPHRIALLRNLATALFERERIRTTLMKAKELRPYAEKLITQAKRDDNRLHARRLVAREIHDLTIVKKLFDDLGARYASRPGGYTRILRLGPRRGDGAEMAIVELLGSEYQPEKPEEKGKKTESESKPRPKAKAKTGKAAGAARKARVAKSAGEEKAGGAKKKSAAKGGAMKKKAAAEEAE